ncbi:MAG TPA: flippase [Methylophaga sp.]|nr:flippase [Methylophaga sp.]
MIAKLKALRQHQGFVRYFQNTSWLMGEKILRMSVGLFVGIWVARYLGPEQFGLLSYAQSFVFLFTVIATLGLDGIVVRELVKDKTQRDVLLGTAFGLKLIGAFLILPILAIAVQLTSNDNYTNLLVFIIASATIFQSFNVIDFYYQSKVLSKYVALANTVSFTLSSVIKVALIMNHAPLIAFAIMTVFDMVVITIGLIVYYRKSSHLKLLNWLFDWSMAKSLLKNSWPLILSGFVLMIQARIDQVMLKEMVGNIEVGFYSVAMRLIETFAFLPMIFQNSLYPSIQNAKNDSVELYQNRLLNFYRLNFILFLITAIPIFIFSEQLVVFLFGEDYQPAGALLSLMAMRLFFANMGVARGVYILTENLMKYSMISMVLGTTTNIILNYLWIDEYGGKGAIIATIISFFVTIFLIDMLYSKTRGNVFLQVKSILTFYKINLRS